MDLITVIDLENGFVEITYISAVVPSEDRFFIRFKIEIPGP